MYYMVELNFSTVPYLYFFENFNRQLPVSVCRFAYDRSESPYKLDLDQEYLSFIRKHLLRTLFCSSFMNELWGTSS